MRIISIDPGITGALCRMDGDDVEVRDCPTFDPKDAKRTIDAAQLADIIDAWTEGPPGTFSIVIEEVHAIPQIPGRSNIGTSQMFAMGRGYGIYIGIFAGLRVPYTSVRGAVWKKALHISADKEAARQRASQMMPRHAHLWARKKDHGRAEAALIGCYHSSKIGLLPPAPLQLKLVAP
jgi:hypothetical protein